MPTDPRHLRGVAPLLDAWLRFHEDAPTPFTIPGHKQRHDLVGDVVAGDVPLYAGLDTMKLSRGVVAEAEGRAARLWGADLCRFSVGGSTHGNQALALTVGRPGDRVVVARTLHRSMLLGLVLAGLEPVWVRPEVDAAHGLPLGVTASDLEAALAAAPDATAVLIGDPSYVGTVGDVGALAAVSHAHGIPLVVDAAWGAHFGFHPALPPHALAAGADALVTSAHKTLPAWSQGALLLARSRRISRARFDAAVDATATTSPAGAILASIDASRALLERDGEALLGPVVEAVAAARRRLAQLTGLVVLDGPAVDPMRLVLVLPGTGADGNEVEADLLARGMPVEMADRDTIVAMVTLADSPERVEDLAVALVESVQGRRGRPRPVVVSGVWAVDPVPAMSPREAFFAERESVPVERAVGRVSAEIVAPYPPGIPVLAPGEVVTVDVVEALRAARASGSRIAYAADPSGHTLDVVVE
ncbi:aminotransferase class I/II-fold pyridoxal phosphate-dependent enzyme [Fodinibacter luteus]|uniref:Aminotransferase class I/II-fold pyridoxal phosphate-dependent enzyme n=1 Tax=Fodinibacter luteus TaxID=552064 RepID=A0ABP8KK88_9MICO